MIAGNGLRNLINNFLNDPLVRDVFEAEETVDFDKALEYGEVIILNYALERGDSVATGFGLFFLLSYETAVLRRPGSENDRIKNFIYIDELPVLLHPKLQSFFTLFSPVPGCCHLCHPDTGSGKKNTA